MKNDCLVGRLVSPPRQTGHKSSLALLIFFCLLLTGSLAFAQTQTVTGTVKDESGSALQGVSVIVKGSQRGVTTNGRGQFTIGLPGPATLVISYTGYVPKEVAASAGNNLSVSLQRDANALTDVVVVGYGTQRRRDVTGAVSTVDLANVKDVPAANPGKLLVGQVPGVLVRQNTGEPGKPLQINVRGISSLGAGSDPLYVIDGFPFGSSIGRNINPNDIESITVLKDAVSSAIYGARGSNGVILITTKKAKTNQHYTSFAASYGIQNVPQSRRVKMMNAQEFTQFKKEIFEDKVRAFENREPTEADVPEAFRHPELVTNSTDWYDVLLKDNAPFQNYNMTYAHGTEKFHSLLSVGYNKQDGMVRYTGYDRFSMLANLDGKINDFITVGTKLNGSFARNRRANGGTEGRGSTFGIGLIADPREPVYDENGDLKPYLGGQDVVFGFPNPLLTLRDASNKDETADLLSNVYVEVSFLKHFKFKSVLNARLSFLNSKSFKPSTIGGTQAPPPQNATLDQNSTYVMNYAADQLLTYDNQFTNSRLEVLAGYTAQQETLKSLSGNASQFPNDLTPYLGSGAQKSATSGESGWTTAAFFGRASYNYDDRYLLSATFRREGSSRFGESNKYGDFPAVSAGWRLINENFFPQNSFLSDLKLRGSYGITGNNAIGDYTSLAFMAGNDYILGNTLARGLVVENLPNTNLKWEISKTLDIGLDLTAFENKLTFTADYYDKKTNDMLLNVQIPAVSGFNNYFTNIGDVQNKGWEFSLGYNSKFGEFGFHSGINISFNKSKVLAIRGGEDRIVSGSFYGLQNISQVGQPLAMLLGFKTMGIFQNQDEIDKAPVQDGAIPGVYRMMDGDGDGVISYDNKDMVTIGNPTPAYTYGINLGVDFKNFDLSVVCTGAGDYKIYREIEESTMNMDGVFNVLVEAKDRWRSESIPGNGRFATTNTWQWERESNDRYVYDGDHFWIRNVSLGYSFPAPNKAFKSLRLYGTVDNFLVFTNYPGGNPEVNNYGGLSAGSDDESYPLPRIFTLGLNVTF